MYYSNLDGSFDSDGDGNWDYQYNSIEKTINQIEQNNININNYFFNLFILVIIFLIILFIFYFIKYRKNYDK